MKEVFSLVIGALILGIPVFALAIWLFVIGFLIGDQFGWFRAPASPRSRSNDPDPPSTS